MPEAVRTALGFDFGLTKIGVAIGQTLTRVASPLAIVKAVDGKPHWDELDKIIATWAPDIFIVGYPLHMDGSVNEMAQRAARFSRRLTGRYHIPAELSDERLSSFAAREQCGHQRQPIDDIAAQIILQQWLSHY